jgi:hypothetical protein
MDEHEVRFDVPLGCRCWMVRGRDLPIPPICNDFEANDAGTIGDAPMCVNCTHAQECHPMLVPAS